MKLAYDRSVDAAYIQIATEISAGGVAKTHPCDPLVIEGEINLDFDAQGRLIGIEVLDASKKLPRELLERAVSETSDRSGREAMTIIDQAEHLRLTVREELSRCRAVLEEVGLTSSEPGLVIWSRGVDEYTAELKVEFYQNENIVDLFEFFVCRGGVLTTSEDEVRQWIRDNVPDVIARRTKD